MANIHILDNGNSRNNGVMAMAMGFCHGLKKICGSSDNITIVLNNARSFTIETQRFARSGLTAVPDGLARWQSGPRKTSPLFNRLFPVTGQIWKWGQKHQIKLATLGGWQAHEADVVISLCGEDYFSDNWPKIRCHYCDLQYSLLHDLKIPYAIFAQTFGPFQRPYSRTLAIKHLSNAHLVTARDDVSFENVKALGVQDQLYRTGDLAFLLEPMPWEDFHQSHEELASFNTSESKWVGVSVSNLFAKNVYHSLSSSAERSDAFFMQMAAGLDAILEKHDQLKLLFTPHVTLAGEWDDRLAGDRVIAKMKQANRVISLQDHYTAGEIKAIIGRCDAFIGCRMHAIIAAVSQGVPTLPLAYSPKTLDVVGKGLNYPINLDFRSLPPSQTADMLLEKMNEVLDRRDELSKLLIDETEKVKVISYQNFELLKPLLR